ncbi:hypothetical protein D3C78_1935710 [compost metagenome]
MAQGVGNALAHTQRQEQEQHAEHGTGDGPAEAARQQLAGKLVAQQPQEGFDHRQLTGVTRLAARNSGGIGRVLA